jgi:acetolactate synthase I/II/III large subunit
METPTRRGRLASTFLPICAPSGSSRATPPTYCLLHEVGRFLEPDAAVVADGGDILSFARVALSARTYLDCGALGCLGVGVPFANAAALLAPGRQVVAVIGDGSFGFTAMEIDTAVRQGLAPAYVIANNQAWGIEKTDQLQRFGGRAIGVDLAGCRYDRLAQSLGASGRRVTSADELHEALAWARDRAPAVLDVLVTQDAQSPTPCPAWRSSRPTRRSPSGSRPRTPRIGHSGARRRRAATARGQTWICSNRIDVIKNRRS